MALYANYIPNPSIELGTTGWTAYNSGTPSRVGSNASSGTYSLKIVMAGAQNSFGGAQAVVNITPGAPAYTLSLFITGATENHGAANSAGTKVTVYDLLPGQATNLAQQLKTQTFARTTNGRVAVRNCAPRATADRLLITIETASTYFQAQQTSTESTGTVWVQGSLSGSSGGITSPSGTEISSSEWNTYEATWTRTGYTTFLYRNNFESLTYNAKSATFTKTTVIAPAVDGGTSTVYVDAIQLEQGTVETSYVDGSTPGYVWSGSPHNSATLNVAFLEAHGTATLSGPLAQMLKVKFMQSAGTITLTGTAELKAEGTVKATGTAMTATGTATVWHSGAMKSAGTGGVIGSAQLYTFKSLEAHGTAMGAAGGANIPKATIRLAWDIGGSTGTPMSLTGSVDITFPQPISASGSPMVVSGTANLKIGWQLSSAGTMSLSGQADLGDATPAGAFADFAIYSVATTDSDPLKLGIGGGNAGTNSGANGAGWVRIHSEFMAPADQPSSSGYAWRRAAYAAVGFTFATVPAGNWQELANIQWEVSSTDASPGPRAYATAKAIRPLVWADRINYANGSWWSFFGSSNLTNTNGAASPYPHDPFPIRVLTYQTSTYTGFFGSNIVSPPPGSYCIASFYVKGTLPSITARILNNADLTEIGASEVTPISNTTWTRIEIPFISAEVEQIFCINDPSRALTYPHTLQVAGVMVERGTRVGDYFHFTAGTTDYYYRNNGSDPTTGVFYYKNIGERIPVLTAALKEHAPNSILVTAPEFGLVPTLD